MAGGKMMTKTVRKHIQEGHPEMVSKEDLEMFLENEEGRESWSPDGIKNVYNAICYEAIRDYKKARRFILIHTNDKWRQKEVADAVRDKEQIEAFFGSDFFKNVSGCHDKKKVIQAVEADMRREAMATMIH